MRFLTIMAVVLGALVIPGTAFADHGGNNENCAYAAGDQVHSGDLVPGEKTVVVYADADGNGGSSGQAGVSAGACADFNDEKSAGPVRFDGGTVEAGAGEDPGSGNGDPGLVAGQPDLYAVVDGDDDNVDPQSQSDGYFGVSKWESSNGRVSQAQCQASGPNNGNAGSSNSGGCVGPAGGPWVYVPGDLPTPVCGNTSGNAWDGSGSDGLHNRDGCQFP